MFHMQYIIMKYFIAIYAHLGIFMSSEKLIVSLLWQLK